MQCFLTCERIISIYTVLESVLKVLPRIQHSAPRDRPGDALGIRTCHPMTAGGVCSTEDSVNTPRYLGLTCTFVLLRYHTAGVAQKEDVEKISSLLFGVVRIRKVWGHQNSPFQGPLKCPWPVLFSHLLKHLSALD